MRYTLGQAAKAVGMSKTSILRSIKAGGSVQGGMSSANGQSSPASCTGFTRPSLMKAVRRTVRGNEP